MKICEDQLTEFQVLSAERGMDVELEPQADGRYIATYTAKSARTYLTIRQIRSLIRSYKADKATDAFLRSANS